MKPLHPGAHITQILSLHPRHSEQRCVQPTFLLVLLPPHDLSSLLRVYLNILPEIPMNAKDTVAQFKQTMDMLISKYATRLLKLNVDEIEVKVGLETLLLLRNLHPRSMSYTRLHIVTHALCCCTAGEGE